MEVLSTETGLHEIMLLRRPVDPRQQPTDRVYRQIFDDRNRNREIWKMSHIHARVGAIFQIFQTLAGTRK